MAPLFSNIITLADAWDEPNPNTGTIAAVIGGGVNAGSAATALNVARIASRSPLLLIGLMENDNSNVYIMHSPTVYEPNPLDPNGFNDHIVAFCGNDIDACIPIVLDRNHAFVRPNPVACLTMAELAGPNGFTGGDLRRGPHNNGDANTTNITSRRVMPCLLLLQIAS